MRGDRPFKETLFRGLGNSEWGLETTLERAHPLERCDETMGFLEYYRKVHASLASVETLTGKRWENIPSPPEFEQLQREFNNVDSSGFLHQHPEVYEYLIYLRHHGFPSPLLDWTASPYVAAFFAFDGMRSKDIEWVFVRVLLQDTMHFASNEPTIYVLGPYIRAHPRHLLQQSRYSICTELRDGRYFFARHDDARGGAPGLAGEQLTIKISANLRSAALKHLDLMNINPFSLIGSEDSLIRTVARRECLFQKWNL